MAVPGHYMADRIQNSTLRFVNFYRQFVTDDLLPMFRDIEKRAEKVGDEEYERLGAQPAGEDWDGDMGALAEAAEDEAIAFYETMTALRQSVLNLFAVGLFHLLEQQLADLCRDGAFTVPPPRDVNINAVADWYQQHFVLDLRRLPAWSTIDELRLVANATKHAEGRSAEQLREKRPELFRYPPPGEMFLGNVPRPITQPLAGEDFYVTPEIMEEYSQSVVTFVSAIAKYFEEHGDEYYPR
jgi:hypothetical protein